MADPTELPPGSFVPGVQQKGVEGPPAPVPLTSAASQSLAGIPIGTVSIAPPSTSSSSPFSAYGNLSTGWKIVYGVIAIALFVWIAQTKAAPIAIALLIAGIVYQIVK